MNSISRSYNCIWILYIIAVWIDNIYKRMHFNWWFYYHCKYAIIHAVVLINECALGLDNCDVNAVCTDTVTSFECACQSGYSGSGVNCTGKIIFSMCLHLMYLHEQVKGTLQFYDMSNSNGITVQVHKCYSWSLLTTAIGSEEANKQMCMPYWSIRPVKIMYILLAY